MKCLRCNKEKELQVTETTKDGVTVGFCSDCWTEVDISGSCLYCNATEDLFINAMWRGRTIEHICGYCRATKG